MLLPNILLNSFLKRLIAQHHPKSCTDRYPDLPSLRVKLLRLEARQNVNQIRVLSLPAEQNLRCRSQPNWRLCASTAWAKGATRISGQLRPVKSPWNSTQNSEALIPPLAPVGIISKALCSGYLAAAVFIHTTIERFFSKHWSPEEKKEETTLQLQGPCLTQLFPWHLPYGIHFSVDTSKSWRRELRTDTSEVAATASMAQSTSSHRNMQPPHQCLTTSKHSPSALDFYVSTKHLGFKLYSS